MFLLRIPNPLTCLTARNFYKKFYKIGVAQLSSETSKELEEIPDFDLKGFKDMRISTKTLRMLSVIERSLKFDSLQDVTDLYFDSKVRLNGEVPKKKAIKVRKCDVLDVIRNIEEDHVMLQRVIIKDCNLRSTKNNKPYYAIDLRRWIKPIRKERKT